AAAVPAPAASIASPAAPRHSCTPLSRTSLRLLMSPPSSLRRRRIIVPDVGDAPPDAVLPLLPHRDRLSVDYDRLAVGAREGHAIAFPRPVEIAAARYGDVLGLPVNTEPGRLEALHDVLSDRGLARDRWSS